MLIPVRSLKSRRPALFLLAVLLVTVTACSFKSLYNRLDYLIPSYVEGMVTLDDVLEEKVEQRTQLLLNWHRNTQLKQYAQLLRTFQHDIGPRLSEERVLQHIAAMETFWQLLSQKINREMAEILPLLDDRQQQELFTSIASKNEEFRTDYVELDNDERIAAYTETMLDIYENWLGDLTEAQELAIDKAAARLQVTAGLRLQKRIQWQNSIRKILASADDVATRSHRLSDFFQHFSNDDAELATAMESNKRIIAQLTVQIIHGLNTDQKQYFLEKSDEYIRIFTELAENR